MRRRWVITACVLLGTGGSATAATLTVPAALSLKSWAVFTPGPFETVTFYDLSTPRATLESDTAQNSAAGLAAFADAGTGTVYGSQDYVDADDDTTKLVPLNAAAVAAITSAIGNGDFRLGGAVTTLDALTDNLDFVYGISQTPDPAPTLVLTTVPEPHAPTALAALAGTALLRRRSVRHLGPRASFCPSTFTLRH